MKEDMVNTLMASKDIAINEQKKRIEDLEAQLDELHKYVQSSKLDPEDPLAQEQHQEARQTILDKIALDEETSEQLSSNSSDNE